MCWKRHHSPLVPSQTKKSNFQQTKYQTNLPFTLGVTVATVAEVYQTVASLADEVSGSSVLGLEECFHCAVTCPVCSGGTKSRILWVKSCNSLSVFAFCGLLWVRVRWMEIGDQFVSRENRVISNVAIYTLLNRFCLFFFPSL